MNCVEFKSDVEELFHSISFKLNDILQTFYKPYGLTAVQAVILIALYQNGPGKMSDIAKELNMTNSNLSVICRRLEKSGFLLRLRDQSDQRVVSLHLTENCNKMMASLDEQITTDYLCPLEQASEEDRVLIIKGLKKLESLLTPTEERVR